MCGQLTRTYPEIMGVRYGCIKSGRFNDRGRMTASLRESRPESPPIRSPVFIVRTLAAAYGHLGREEEAAATSRSSRSQTISSHPTKGMSYKSDDETSTLRRSASGRFLSFNALIFASPDRPLLGESGHWDASSKSHVYDIHERPPVCGYVSLATPAILSANFTWLSSCGS